MDSLALWLSPSFALPPLIGGAMIGAAAAILAVFLGRVAGVSGIIAQATRSMRLSGGDGWRIAFLIGLVAAPFVLGFFGGDTDTGPLPSPVALMVAGLLVGLGAGIGSGCTSGHGVCGLARLSARSLVATAVFMTTAALTVLVIRHLI